MKMLVKEGKLEKRPLKRNPETDANKKTLPEIDEKEFISLYQKSTIKDLMKHFKTSQYGVTSFTRKLANAGKISLKQKRKTV